MSDRRPLPTIHEVAIGAHLHDIGKFMQRAVGDVDALPQTVRNRISDVLPSFQGRPTHFHALFSDAFFDECVDRNPLPAAVDGRWIRDCAVYHHRPLNDGVAVPNGSITHLVAVSDRVAAAMERKQRDAEQESSTDPKVRDRYRRARLAAAPSTICIRGREAPERRYYPISEIGPDALLTLKSQPVGAEAIGQYKAEWPRFVEAYSQLAHRAGDDLDAYVEGLIALSERFCWSVPSSTIDDPDVSLHDHGRVAAAVAACLHRHHEFAGDLTDEAAVRNPDRNKFRLLAGDLSGIQSALFRLQSEGVKGLARLLRGRSFRMQLITEAAARRGCQAFGLPLYNVIQLAGGRFLILVPDTGPGEAKARASDLRAEIDDWMLHEYVGDLALNLALTDSLSARDLIDRLPEVYRGLGDAVEEAKLKPLCTQPLGVVALPFDPDLGVCAGCGVRPARRRDPQDGTARCSACAAEVEVGRRLIKAEAVEVLPAASAHRNGDHIFGLGFRVLDGSANGGAPTGFRRRGSPFAMERPAADRFFVAYAPRHTAETLACERLRAARVESGDDGDPEAGDLVTFAELAILATETRDGRTFGRPMLALLKADVDDLGQVFVNGLGERRSLSRTAALSRLMDAFFTGWLPHHLQNRFPNLYTVYAGGDDVMVLGPWLDILRFAPSLRTAFGRFSGGNPSLTLSAGVELFDRRTPVSLAAAGAEVRLEAAKLEQGKDCICAMGPANEAMTWNEWQKALDEAEEVHRLVVEQTVSTSLLYRLLALDDRRRRSSADPACADWRAKLGYTLFRSVNADARVGNQSVRERLLALMGVDASLADVPERSWARIAMTIALYRNR